MIVGRSRGKDLGTPTINLDPEEVPASLHHGVYACIVGIDPKKFAVMHFGPRPSFHDTLSCEVHILDTEVQQAPERMQVRVMHFLREIMAFPTAEDLQKQISHDVQSARSFLQVHGTV